VKTLDSERQIPHFLSCAQSRLKQTTTK
jgi:hypothetical protein